VREKAEDSMSSNGQFYNPNIPPLMEIVDKDNGKGYNKNIHSKGMIIRVPNSTTEMLYEVEIREPNIKIVIIRYIHYDTKRQLLTLLAFAAQWWMRLKPNMVYYFEKDRKNGVGKYLELIGFQTQRIANKMKPFDCLQCGNPLKCQCKVSEYYVYGVGKRKKNRRTGGRNLETIN
jgi:hypothetical protein